MGVCEGSVHLQESDSSARLLKRMQEILRDHTALREKENSARQRFVQTPGTIASNVLVLTRAARPGYLGRRALNDFSAMR